MVVKEVAQLRDLDSIAQEMMDELVATAPRFDKEAMRRRLVVRIQQDKRRRLIRRAGTAVACLAILIVSLVVTKPHYALFSWHEVMLKFGAVVSSHDPTLPALIPLVSSPIDLGEAAKDLPYVPRIPRALPPGYKLDKVTAKPLNKAITEPTMVFRHEGGGAITIREKNLPMSSAFTIGYDPESIKAEQVKVGPVEGTLLTSDEGLNSLIVPYELLQITIDARLPAEELIKIGRSMVTD